MTALATQQTRQQQADAQRNLVCKTSVSANRSPASASLAVKKRQSHFVSAAPFRAWLLQLISDTGQPWRVIAEIGNIPTEVVRALAFGRYGQQLSTIRRQDAIALLEITAAKIKDLSRTPTPLEPLRNDMITLVRHGYRVDQLAIFGKLSRSECLTVLNGGTIWISQLSALRIRAACRGAVENHQAKQQPARTQLKRAS